MRSLIPVGLTWLNKGYIYINIKKNLHIDATDRSDSSVALLWWVEVLTGAAQPLLPQPQQHALAHVAVNRLVEVLHPPEVLAVLLRHLVEQRRGSRTEREREREEHCGLMFAQT